MEYLKELVSFINQNKIKQNDSLMPGGTNRHSKIYQLYQGILDGDIEADEDIAEAFFADTDHQMAYTNRLKRKLRDRLTNTLFLVDVNQPQYNDIQRALITCQKNLAALQILGALYARKSAIELAKNTLRQAQHYHFTEICLSICRYLHLAYGTAYMNKTKTQEYRDLMLSYERTLNYEIKAEQAFIEVNQINTFRSAPSEEVQKKARQYTEDLWPMIDQIKTPRFNIYVFLLHLTYCELQGDYAGMVHICNKAIAFYRDHPELANVNAHYVFSLNSMVALTQLRRFSEAEEAGQRGMSLVKNGSGPWFSLGHYLMVVYYYSEQYTKAFQLFQHIKEHRNYSNQSGIHRERWRIHEAFLYFFSQTLDLDLPQNLFSNFRVGTFLNEVPDSSKDKEGANANILMLQILIFLVQRKYDQIIQRTDSLKTYTSRYLRKDKNFRSNCFLKMLLQLPAADFHRAGVERKAEYYRKRLFGEPANPVHYGVDQEYVPYETLWKYVLQNLEHKFHYS